MSRRLLSLKSHGRIDGDAAPGRGKASGKPGRRAATPKRKSRKAGQLEKLVFHRGGSRA